MLESEQECLESEQEWHYREQERLDSEQQLANEENEQIDNIVDTGGQFIADVNDASDKQLTNCRCR
jgi:hypothetical protein